MSQASVVLFWFSLALYIAATVLYAYQFVLKRSKVGWWARFCTGAGFICQTLSIGAHSISTDGTQLTGPNQLMLASWALVLLYFVMEHLIKIKIYGTFLIPVAVLFMGASQIMGGFMAPAELTEVQAMQLDSWRITFHVALIVFANAGFAFGAVSSGIYLFQEGKLKSHTSNIVTRRLPSLSTLQLIARRAISFSFPVYTAGLLLGILRAVELDVDQLVLRPAHHAVRYRMAGVRHLPRARLPAATCRTARRRGSHSAGSSSSSSSPSSRVPFRWASTSSAARG